jgi:hypothetical protein
VFLLHEIQGRFTTLIPERVIASRLNQVNDGWNTTIISSIHQRGLTILMLQVDTASAGDKQLTYLLTTIKNSLHQRGLTIFILQVDIASAGDEQLTYFLMTINSSLYQRGRTILIHTVHL